jgi:hypothetical protein
MVLLDWQGQTQPRFGVWKNQDSTGIIGGFESQTRLSRFEPLVFVLECGSQMPVLRKT